MNQTQQTVPKLAYGLLFLLAAIWGSSFILIKKGLIAFDAGQVGALRMVFASVTLMPFAWKNFRQTSGKLIPLIIFSGFLGNLIPAFLFAKAETVLSSSATGILNTLTPLLTMGFSIVFFKVKSSWYQFLGLMIGLLGSISLILFQGSNTVGGINLFGLFVICGAMCYALNVNLIKAYLGHVSPLGLASMSLSVVGPFAFVYLLTTDFIEQIPGATDEFWWSIAALAILGAVGTAIALVIFNRVVQMTSAVFASSVTYIIPVVAIFWGIIDQEQISAYQLIGLVLILLGILLSGKK